MPAISTNALSLVVADLGIALPYPLEARPRGATSAERAELRRQAGAELRDAELLDRTGHLAPRVEGWLRLLARPELSVDSAFLPALGVPPVRAVVARSGRSAVLASQHDGTAVRLRPVCADRLEAVIVEMLPAAGRGTETSLSLPAGELGGAHSQDRQALARLSAAPRDRGGQIAANSVSDVRGRRRSPVLSWFDSGGGRYFAQERGARDGRRWVTIAPADSPTLRNRIGELVREVTS